MKPYKGYLEPFNSHATFQWSHGTFLAAWNLPIAMQPSQLHVANNLELEERGHLQEWAKTAFLVGWQRPAGSVVALEEQGGMGGPDLDTGRQ
jgi:hypothetical protein